jgi:hypothetical protein
VILGIFTQSVQVLLKSSLQTIHFPLICVCAFKALRWSEFSSAIPEGASLCSTTTNEGEAGCAPKVGRRLLLEKRTLQQHDH